MKTETATATETEPMMKKIFICSPFSPSGKTEEELRKDSERNILLAQTACRYAALNGCIPFAPHLYFTQFLEDGNQDERSYGQVLGLYWLSKCDELWVVGRKISTGMIREIRKAKEWGIPMKIYVMERTPEERILDDIFFPELEINELVFKGGK